MSKKEKRDRLIELGRQTLSDFQTGNIQRLPTQKALSEAAGYTSIGHASHTLETSGIKAELEKARAESLLKPYKPSTELAWIIGYFSKHGSVRENTLAVKDETPQTLNKFRQNVRVALEYPAFKDESKPRDSVGIHSKEIVNRLGNISRRDYFKTLIEKFPWIKTEASYTYSYLEGLLDARGSFAYRQVFIRVPEEGFADYILELFNIVNIDGATKHFSDNGKHWRISLSNARDLKLLALNINLVNPDKAKVIEDFRRLRIPLHSRNTPDSSCVHKWFIDEPSGKFSMGLCKCCGGSKMFRNSLDENAVFNPSGNSRFEKLRQSEE